MRYLIVAALAAALAACAASAVTPEACEAAGGVWEAFSIGHYGGSTPSEACLSK